MKYNILVFICLFSLQSLLAQNVDNTPYYVWAKSGLSLRNVPNKDAEKLTIIPFGDKVTVISNTHETFSISEFAGFEYSDNWLEVKYNNQTGYAFAGYLSIIKPPKILDVSDLTTYLNSCFTIVETTVYSKYDGCNDDNPECIKSAQKTYKEGINYTFWYGEGGGTETLSVPKLNILQAFTLGTIFCDSYKQFKVTYSEKPLPTIVVERDDVGCDFTITILADYAIIHWSGGC